VVAEVAEQSSVVRAVAASHRIGVLRIGEAALVVAVAADHRHAAFATCAQLVDAIKARLPVWKHQFFADGADEWVGSA
jgi:molybdopterin synthase catalytic subunit